MEPDLAAIREYWRSPTGVRLAPPGMVELAQRNIDDLCGEIENMRSERDRYRTALQNLLAAVENGLKSRGGHHVTIVLPPVESALAAARSVLTKETT